MEAILLHPSPDQSISPYKHQIRNPRRDQIRNPRKNNRPFIPPSNFHGGLLYTPPPSLSYSIPPFSTLRPPPPPHQPPLLPLPISKPYNNNNSRSRGLSCPPVNRKINNRSRHQSLTPKKSKPSITSQERTKSECVMIASTNRLGPDPAELPKDVSGVLSSPSSPQGNSNNTRNGVSTLTPVVDIFSGSAVFTLSPPPSSLPLPTFSLRPKISCNAVAGGIDAGATDSLRRLLRLR